MLRLRIADDFVEVTLSAQMAFSKRSWPFVLATAIPWLLCAGQRSITRIFSLAVHPRSRSAYYRFLSEGKWRLELLFRSLFGLVVRRFRLQEMTLVLDDTLCPKWGRSIYGTAYFFDHAGRPRPGYIWGHNWIVLAVVVPVGKIGWVSLPFWIGLYRPRTSCRKQEFRTRHEIAVEALRRVRSWFPGPIRLLADGAYANRSLVTPVREMDIEIVSRIRSDARLREPVPRRQPKSKRGRKPKWGPWLPKLKVLARQSRHFRTERASMYGKQVKLELREIVAWWPPLRCTVKVVITRDPKNSKRLAFLWTTDLALSPRQVVEAFAQRWTIEQMFSVAKIQLGLDSAEVRKERSVLRHAALCMALLTWVEVWAHRRHPRLRERAFSAKIAAIRGETIKQTIFASGPRVQGSRTIANDMAKLVTVVAQAA